jgi:DNA-binding MarR family transcriptional regulator
VSAIPDLVASKVEPMKVTPRWLDEREARAWRGYLSMSELLRAELARDLQEHSGLSDADYGVLVELSEARGGRLRTGELAHDLVWSMSRTSHQLRRMEDRGLVVRETCAADGRGTEVVITAPGRRALRRAAPAHVASVRRHFVDLLGPAELDALASVAERVTQHLRPDADEAEGREAPHP